MSCVKIKIRAPGFRRTLLWALVLLYVILLPYAIITYNALVNRFSAAFAHAVPIILIVLLAAGYAIYGFLSAGRAKVLGVMAVCTVLVFILFSMEANPNKLIHIPEYICLTWLVFLAISTDYSGKGALFLVWMCTAMLGVVDELQQGVLPDRFYGGQDMLANAVSSVIGILALAGLNRSRRRPVPRAWIHELKKQQTALLTAIWGAAGATLSCSHLFRIKAAGLQMNAYPSWLLIWHTAFLAVCPIVLVAAHRKTAQQACKIPSEDPVRRHPEGLTACLWIFLPLMILLAMHEIPLCAVVFDWEFR